MARATDAMTEVVACPPMFVVFLVFNMKTPSHRHFSPFERHQKAKSRFGKAVCNIRIAELTHLKAEFIPRVRNSVKF